MVDLINKYRFLVASAGEFQARYNIAPTHIVPVFTERGALPMRWGLVPHWARDTSIGAKLISARSETPAEKPSFREAFKKRRCLVPATGFYEWKKEGGGKTPHYISLADDSPFVFAGLREGGFVKHGLPDINQAPSALWKLEGPCGPLSTWWALRYFHKRVAAREIINKVRYTNNHGTFMSCVAVALQGFGLKVEFFSAPDPSPNYYERIARKRADKLGVIKRRSVSLDSLLSELNDDTIALVLYQLRDGTPHMTLILGKKNRKLIAPLAEGELSVHEFKWGGEQPGILHQAIIVRSE